MYKINNISFSNYGILAGKVSGEGIALKGCFDMPKRIGDTHYSWAEEDGVQPFVDADEIFLDAREIQFAGVLIGSKTLLKTHLKAFKTLIFGFTDLVLLETPYGSFSVKVISVLTDIKEGAATIKINFREPIVGLLVDNEIDQEVTYNSAEYSETAIKNNCDAGFSGSEVTLTAAVGAFTSILSQAAANQLAIDWVRETKQDYANVNGVCTANPTIYYNTRLEIVKKKNNCTDGLGGVPLVYVVAAFTYSSLISQVDADTKAQQDADINFTQSFVNENGTCVIVPTISNFINATYIQSYNGYPTPYRYQVFSLDGGVTVGDVYYFQCYLVELTYEVQTGDTTFDVINYFFSLIGNLANPVTTPVDWNAENAAPLNDAMLYYAPDFKIIYNTDPVTQFSVKINVATTIKFGIK